jgi:hypothetical protein
MATIEEIQKFIKAVYLIIDQNRNESEATKVKEIKRYVERSVQS